MNPTQPRQRRGASRTLILSCTLIILALIGAYVSIKTTEKAAEAPAKTIDAAKAFAIECSQAAGNIWVKVTTPKAAYANKTIVLGDKSITELATLSETYIHEATYRTHWLGSEKTVIVRGTFTAKAGYTFHDPLELRFDPDLSSVKVAFPAAQVLSNELNNPEFQTDNGLWNKIQDEDLAAASRYLKQTADERLKKEGFTEKAEQRFLESLEKALHKNNKEIKIERIVL